MKPTDTPKTSKETLYYDFDLKTLIETRLDELRISKNEIADEIPISRQAFFARLQSANWKVFDIIRLCELTKFNYLYAYSKFVEDLLEGHTPKTFSNTQYLALQKKLRETQKKLDKSEHALSAQIELVSYKNQEIKDLKRKAKE